MSIKNTTANSRTYKWVIWIVRLLFIQGFGSILFLSFSKKFNQKVKNLTQLYLMIPYIIRWFTSHWSPCYFFSAGAIFCIVIIVFSTDAGPLKKNHLKKWPPTRFLVIRTPNGLLIKIPGDVGLAPCSISRYSPKSNMAAKRLVWSHQLFFYEMKRWGSYNIRLLVRVSAFHIW